MSTPPADSLAADLPVREAVFHLMRRVLQEHGAAWQTRSPQLTKPQYAILRAVADQPGIDQLTLGQRAAIDKATLASVLLRMEQRGLITRAVDPADRRRRLVELTDAGRAELHRSVQVAHAVNADVLASLTPQECEQLKALLGKISG